MLVAFSYLGVRIKDTSCFVSAVRVCACVWGGIRKSSFWAL